ncbi:MAG: hypothetical protein AAF648_16930 [Pseudomonadota bacterium]
MKSQRRRESDHFLVDAVVTDLNEVPLRFQELYSHRRANRNDRAGWWEMDRVRGMKTDKDVTRLTSALEKERGDHRVTKERLAAAIDLKGDRVGRSVLGRLLENLKLLEELLSGAVELPEATANVLRFQVEQLRSIATDLEGED